MENQNLDSVKIYSQLKNNYRALYRSIFYRITLTDSFQNGNQEKRLETLRKARYAFLMELIERNTDNANDALKLIPLTCFNDHPITTVKSLQFIPDCKKYIFNPYKN